MRQQLPYIKFEGSYNIITLRLANGELSIKEITLVLNQIKAGHDRFYRLIAAQVMLEHFVMIIQPFNRVPVSRIMKGIISASSGKITLSRREAGRIWQSDYSDKAIRDQRDFQKKLSYMFQSSVRAGLASSGWEWMGWYLEDDE